MSWASGAVSLSPHLFAIYVPLDPALLLSSHFFFFPFSKSLQSRILLWHSQPHLESEAIQELLLRLAVDTEGPWCCGSNPQVPPGSPAGKISSSGAFSTCPWEENFSGVSYINVFLLIKSWRWWNCPILMVLHLPHWMEERDQMHSSASIFMSGVG